MSESPDRDISSHAHGIRWELPSCSADETSSCAVKQSFTLCDHALQEGRLAWEVITWVTKNKTFIRLFSRQKLFSCLHRSKGLAVNYSENAWEAGPRAKFSTSFWQGERQNTRKEVNQQDRLLGCLVIAYQLRCLLYFSRVPPGLQQLLNFNVEYACNAPVLTCHLCTSTKRVPESYKCWVKYSGIYGCCVEPIFNLVSLVVHSGQCDLGH